MAKKNNGKSAAAPADEPRPDDGDGEETPPSLTVIGQYTKDLSFENPGGHASFSETGEPPDININVNVGVADLTDDQYEVTLSINGEAKMGSQTVFLVELVYAGLFHIAGVPDEHMQPLLLIECPRIIFPFARNIIADATREGGFPPLLLQPIDFGALYQEQMQQQTAGA